MSDNSIAYLDLLRACAANLVLIGHATDIFGYKLRLPAGQIGVSMFFLLSGFLICRSSLSRVMRPGPYFLPFVIDRFARIFTAYLPVLILVAFLNTVLVLGAWGQGGLSTGPLAFLGNLLMLQNYPVFQMLHGVLGNAYYVRPYNTAEPFWTIPIEFWIYVAFGLVFFSAFMRERLGKLLLLVLAGISLPVVIWNAAAGGGNGLSFVWLIGAIAAYVWSAGWEGSDRKREIGIGLACIGLVCLVGRGIKNGWDFQDNGMAICEILIFLGGMAVCESLPTLPSSIRNVCLFFASYSFSLYLIHNTILVLSEKYLSALIGKAGFPVALIGAHVSGFILYLLFEKHYRQVGSWLKHGRLSPVRVPSRQLNVAAS